MLRRLTQVLLAFMIAVATTLPVGVGAMPMAADMSGAAMPRHCPTCPTPDKMPACPILACSGGVAMLPTSVVLPERVLLRAVYLMAPPARWTAVAPAPDPFPPRPIALI